MSLIAVASAKSCGVTTSAVALAATWPKDRGVLVAEVDPIGGDLAARFALDPNRGMMSLGAASRGGAEPEDVGRHTQTLPGGASVLVGPSTLEQCRALATLWSALPSQLKALDGTDVIADCGRLTPYSQALEFVRQADVALLVSRPTVEGVMHLSSALARLNSARTETQVVLVGDHPYESSEVERAVGAEVVGVVADDPRAAGALGGRPAHPRALERSALMRSAREIAERLCARLLSRPMKVSSPDGDAVYPVVPPHAFREAAVPSRERQ